MRSSRHCATSVTVGLEQPCEVVAVASAHIAAAAHKEKFPWHCVFHGSLVHNPNLFTFEPRIVTANAD
jgi:hypothetical protein